MKSPIQHLIMGEVAWCEVHRGESGKGEVYEQGFIDGLKQALRVGFNTNAKVLQRLAEIRENPDELAKYNTPEWVMREAFASMRLSNDAAEHGVHPTGGTCPGHAAPIVNGYCFDCGLPRSTSG